MAEQFRAKYGGNKQKQQAASDKSKNTNTSDGSNAGKNVASLQAEVTKQVGTLRFSMSRVVPIDNNFFSCRDFTTSDISKTQAQVWEAHIK